MRTDALETAVIILSSIVIMAILSSLVNKKYQAAIFISGLAAIAYVVIMFYDRAEQGQVNEDKLKEERDKWQESETADR